MNLFLTFPPFKFFKIPSIPMPDHCLLNSGSVVVPAKGKMLYLRYFNLILHRVGSLASRVFTSLVEVKLPATEDRKHMSRYLLAFSVPPPSSEAICVQQLCSVSIKRRYFLSR